MANESSFSFDTVGGVMGKISATYPQTFFSRTSGGRKPRNWITQSTWKVAVEMGNMKWEMLMVAAVSS